MNRSRFRPGLLHRCRRATVAIYIAMLAPVLAGAVALGVEVTSWSDAQLGLQLTADASARAGAISCFDYTLASGGSCRNNSTAAQTAATLAAQLAEQNGATGTSTPTWNAATSTYADNQITAQIVTGVRQSSDAAVQVTVQKTVPLTISRIFTSTPSVTVSASSIGEVTSSSSGGSGGQPCMVALQTKAQGGTGLSAAGSINVNASGCTLVSNNGFSDSGGGSFTLAGIYSVGPLASSTSAAAPNVMIPCWVPINGSSEAQNGCSPWPSSGLLQSNVYVHPNSSVIPDPYASNAAMQAAMAGAASTTGASIACSNQHCTYTPQGGSATAVPSVSGGTALNGTYCTGQGTSSVSCYLQPGDYGGFAVTSGGPYYFIFASGGYVFNGNIDLTNNTTSSGSSSGTGVTIFTTGTFTGANTFNFTLTAPSTTVSNPGGPWQIAGVVLAGSTTQTVSLSGNPQFQVTGVVYFPTATFDSQGYNGLGASTTSCMEIIAGSITVTGATYVSSGCSAVNAESFFSQPGTESYSTALVQ
ncbi:MAG TPA: hypothetical protein VND19_12865 [Acetobacteraceae bacterium]|nr:hypothetical protein [Acetobacteraceae bacterium]